MDTNGKANRAERETARSPASLCFFGSHTAKAAQTIPVGWGGGGGQTQHPNGCFFYTKLCFPVKKKKKKMDNSSSPRPGLQCP